MLRDWLMTPVVNGRLPSDEAYNNAHCGTRTIERCIGVLKRRWHCLHTELRVAPKMACEIICACVILHNRATELNHGLDNDTLQNDNNDDDDNNYTHS
jgi:nuclease HARBI1